MSTLKIQPPVLPSSRPLFPSLLSPSTSTSIETPSSVDQPSNHHHASPTSTQLPPSSALAPFLTSSKDPNLKKLTALTDFIGPLAEPTPIAPQQVCVACY
ncbi:unnamed protein product [Ambrosiozyma monospora]|uniref:Unnamed protein product n=1 Tax=Ambrosiozyma monospora TaxID=43982 RepID=A0A9W6WMN6_AMBMO|nr:unnamed protein product [Ambrosiozyma monospora]